MSKRKAKAASKPAVKAGTSKAAAEERKKQFIEGMMIHNGNQTQAAIYAGFSAKTATVQASRLMRDVKVSGQVDARRAESLAASKLTTDEVQQSLARALRFDPRKLYADDGSLKPVKDLDPDTADVLAGVEVVEMAGGMEVGGEDGVVKHIPMFTKKVKWLDKNTAREQAMKHFGLYEVDNRQKSAPSVHIGQLTVGLDFDKVRTRARTLPQSA